MAITYSIIWEMITYLDVLVCVYSNVYNIIWEMIQIVWEI
jgi:hypothetical protein